MYAQRTKRELTPEEEERRPIGQRLTTVTMCVKASTDTATLVWAISATDTTIQP